MDGSQSHCPRCGAAVSATQAFCGMCGAALAPPAGAAGSRRTAPASVPSPEQVRAVWQAASPPQYLPPPYLPPPQFTADATGGVIPYKNPQALAGYYCGVFALIPMLGLILGPLALVLGALGWRYYRRHPVVKGAVHAWVGMILGALGVLISVAMIWATFFPPWY